MRASIHLGLLLALLATACGTFEVGVEPSPLPQLVPTNTSAPAGGTPILRPTLTPAVGEPVLVTPTPTTPLAQTATPVVGGHMRGTWQQLTTATGFCTDYPLFIGGFFIGTGTTQLCRISGLEWFTVAVPQGTRATAANQFPPGGGWEVVTDAGHCFYNSGKWRCDTEAPGFAYADVRQVVPLITQPVYRLTQAVVYQDHVYDLPTLLGAAAAQPTWLAVSDDVKGTMTPEIWVGTNGYGLLVIDAASGQIRRYTTADGLPSDTIRDVQTGGCTLTCAARDVWVATERGVGYWNGTRWAVYTTADGLPTDDVQGVAAREVNKAWVATSRGAAYFDGTTWQAFTANEGLPVEDLTGVIFAGGSEVAFGTKGHGLLVFSMEP